MRVDYRIIRKKTGCTEEQAIYLSNEIKKLPKLKNQIMEHLDSVNLHNCEKVTLVRLYGYTDEVCNINAYRRNEKKSYKDIVVNSIYIHTFDILFEDQVFKQII